MNLKEMSYEKQVKYLKSLLGTGSNSLLGFFALFSFRHHLATKHSSNYTVKPVLRWYLGQLAKTYIKKYFREAKTTLENLAEKGMLEAKEGMKEDENEFHLEETLYPALRDVLEETFGKEYISKVMERAKYYRNPEYGKTRRLDEDFSEVRK